MTIQMKDIDGLFLNNFEEILNFLFLKISTYSWICPYINIDVRYLTKNNLDLGISVQTPITSFVLSCCLSETTKNILITITYYAGDSERIKRVKKIYKLLDISTGFEQVGQLVQVKDKPQQDKQSNLFYWYKYAEPGDK